MGAFVVEKLQERGAVDMFVPRSQDYELRDLATGHQRRPTPRLGLEAALRQWGRGFTTKVEKDFWEWEQAVTLQRHYESLRPQWM